MTVALAELVRRQRDALLSGDITCLPEIADALESVSVPPDASRTELRRLAAELSRNATLAAAALSGVRAARGALEGGHPLRTYGADGKAREIPPAG